MSLPAPGRSERIRLVSPSAVVAAVPHLLDFRPRRSLVVLLITGEGGRVRATLRADLHRPDDVDEATGEPMTFEAWVRWVVSRTRHADAVAAILVMYPDEEPIVGAPLPGLDVVEAVRVALDDRGIRTKDALCVGAERWWSYQCRDPRCCPPEGKPLDDPQALRVSSSLVLSGSGFAPDRETLEHSLDPVGGVVQARVAALLADAEAAVARLISGQDVRPAELPGEPLVEALPDGRRRPFVPRQVDLAAYEAWRDRCLERLSAAVQHAAERSDERDAVPADVVVAEVVFALHDVRVRDTWLWDLVHTASSRTRLAAAVLLGHCVRRAPAEWTPPAATCAAVCWWTLGNGTMAAVALRAGPGHGAGLLPGGAGRARTEPGTTAGDLP